MPEAPPPPPPPPDYGLAPPPTQQSANDSVWILACHLGTFVGGFIVPLVVLLTKGKESDDIRWHAVEALNFNITLVIAWFAVMLLTVVLVGLVLVPVLLVAQLVLPIVAAVKGYNGERWRYPAILRLVD